MKFIDFFAGIGGFRLGMEMTGHECVGHCEIDKFANESYVAMHNVKEGEWYADDITRVNPGELPEADCYCFGFPCQAFSIAGNRRGFEDTRGTLFFEVMRLAKERKPRILFAENVKGLLNHEGGGRTFGIIISTMDELGYDVEWQVLNSKDFGVPQNRERVFIIGHLRGTGSRKVFPIRDGSKEVDDLQRQETGTITTRTGQASTVGTYIIESKQHAQVKQIIGGSQGNRVYDPSGISVTLSSQGGGQGAKTGLYAIPNPKSDGNLEYYIRKLTPKECFRLQGFSDEYFERARAVNSDSQLYKQAGNSVTVNVIYEIARRLT